MANVNGTEIWDQDAPQSLIEEVLENRSKDFQLRVHKLVNRYDWDVNDPNFLILMATGQMEVLLEKFPEQFEAVFVELLGRLQQQGGELKTWMAQEQGELKEVIRSVEMLQSQIRVTLEERTEQLTAGIAQQQGWVQQQVQEILRISEQERLKTEKALVARVKEMETQITRDISREVFQLVKRAEPVWMWETQRNLILATVAAVFVVFAGGWFDSNWFYESRRAEDKDLQSALKLWEWNSSAVWDCLDKKQETCNLSIVGPKKDKK